MLRDTVPGTAAPHPVAAAASRGPGRSVSRGAGVAAVVAVVGPFVDVAVDVVDAEGVRLEHIGGNGLLAIDALGAAAGIGVDGAVIISLGRRDAGAEPE